MKPLALALLAALTLGAVQDKAVVKLKFDPAKPVKYKSVMDTSSEGFMQSQSKLTVLQTATVTGQKDGWTSLRLTNDDVKVEGDDALGMNAVITQGLKDATVLLEVDESGATRNIALENADKMDPTAKQIYQSTQRSDQVAGFMGIRFPKEAVGIGSTWSAEIDAEKIFEVDETIKSAKGKVPVKFEVIGFEDLNGKRTVKVKTTMDGTLELVIVSPIGELKASTRVSGETMSWVLLSDGLLQKSTSAATVVSTLDLGTQTQKLAVTVERTN